MDKDKQPAAVDQEWHWSNTGDEVWADDGDEIAGPLFGNLNTAPTAAPKDGSR